MGKITEKIIVGEIPDDVKINLDEVPKHQMDAFCRVILRWGKEKFKDPKFQAEYEVWLAERRAKQEASKDSLKRRATRGRVCTV